MAFSDILRATQQLGLVRAADRMFTGSTEGIADAFDLQRDQLIGRYNDLFEAFGQLETVSRETPGE